jgi:hypothetical protein
MNQRELARELAEMLLEVQWWQGKLEQRKAEGDTVRAGICTSVLGMFREEAIRLNRKIGATGRQNG